MTSVRPISAEETNKQIYERNSFTIIQTYLFIALKWIPQLTNHCVVQTALHIVVLNTQHIEKENKRIKFNTAGDWRCICNKEN